MVRNPGLIPGLESIRNGDIGARRRGMYEMMVGLYVPGFMFLFLTVSVGSLALAQVRDRTRLSSPMLSLRIPLLMPISIVPKN
jgi:hypothetical protein